MRKTAILLILSLFLFSCGTTKKGGIHHKNSKIVKHQKRHQKKITYNRVLKSSNYELKYKWANDLYNHGQYDKAADLYEQLAPYYRGYDRGEEVSYKLAYCKFRIAEYYYASYLFKDFYDTYPSSLYAEKALYMSAFCDYLVSPRWSLDQRQTNKAIEKFQLFLTKFPQTNMTDTINTYVQELTHKLQKKSFEAGKLYYNIGAYKAASVTLNNSVKENPDSPFNEEAIYLNALAKYKYAIGSISTKQKERLRDALAECYRYSNNYPSGKYITKIQKITKQIENKLKK